MPELRNKTILLISPQQWGKMFISKHHYAVELAKRGNEVYFLCPPDNDQWKLTGKTKRIKIGAVKEYPNLTLINHQLYFPYQLKFHAKGLYDFLMQKQVNDILAIIKKPVDIIWSFDIGNLYPFRLFGKKSYKIFHPVDEPLNKEAIEAARGCDVIFSVTHEILEKYRSPDVPGYFINHGVTEHFFKPAGIKTDHKTHVGLSGNLLRPDIDRETLLKIIGENDDIVFDFFGSYEQNHANIGGSSDDASAKFIASLKAQKNVVLHGTLGNRELAAAFFDMDCFLICYDIKKDQSKGTNYHKIMEYLSTGKVILSNNVTTYQHEPDLIQMSESRGNNDELPLLFKKVIAHLDDFNSNELRQKRIAFARDNLYCKQIERIEKMISGE
jgi:hypothetical protein